MVVTFSMLGKHGRLGNQMFQYALARSVGIRTGFGMAIPHGDYDLLKLDVQKNWLQPGKIAHKYVEKHFHYADSVFKVNDGTDFFGYFQSEKYFLDIRDVLLKEFSFDDGGKSQRVVDDAMFSDAKNTGTVSLHVRRGDYLKLADFHPFCGIGYCRKCMDYFRSMGNYVFIVCSDDIGWCRENLSGPNVYFSEGNALVDLMTMSRCDHNIIANSSLGWWGAWLNQNPNKIVLYPSRWFGPKCPKDTWDLFPQEWERIET